MKSSAASIISGILPEYIYSNIVKDFQRVHLSGNLSGTIRGSIKAGHSVLVIPADTYDIPLYKKEKVIVYNGIGSYASEVSHTGGFSGVHVGYDERAIDKAIRTAKSNIKGDYPGIRVFVRKYYE